MRSSLGLVSLLIAVAIVMYLFGHQAKKDMQEVRTVTLAVGEATEGKPFAPDSARAMLDRLRSLLDVPALPAAELQEAANTAAAWAAGSPPGTADHHIAVSLQSAALELLAAGRGVDDAHRAIARRHLDGAAMSTVTNRPPDAVSGIRDRLQEIQNSTNQRKLETDSGRE